VGVWAVNDSDPVIKVLGGASFIACLGVAALGFWNVARFRRGERPTL
jgi:hypothetical protein